MAARVLASGRRALAPRLCSRPLGRASRAGGARAATRAQSASCFTSLPRVARPVPRVRSARRVGHSARRSGARGARTMSARAARTMARAVECTNRTLCSQRRATRLPGEPRPEHAIQFSRPAPPLLAACALCSLERAPLEARPPNATCGRSAAGTASRALTHIHTSLFMFTSLSFNRDCVLYSTLRVGRLSGGACVLMCVFASRAEWSVHT